MQNNNVNGDDIMQDDNCFDINGMYQFRLKPGNAVTLFNTATGKGEASYMLSLKRGSYPLNKDDINTISIKTGANEDVIKSVLTDINIHIIERESESNDDSNVLAEGLREPNMENVESLQRGIKSEGFIPFMTSLLNNVMLGDKKPILALLLACFNVIRGTGAYLLEVVSKAGKGKSYQNKHLLIMLPEESVVKYNKMTSASFTRSHSSVFNRKIVYAGDYGGKDCEGSSNCDEQTKAVFDDIKILITEGYLNRLVCDLERETQEFKLELDSIGYLFETVDNGAQKDDQMETRKISVCAPDIDSDELAEFIGLDFNPNSKVAKAKALGIEELAKIGDLIRYHAKDTSDIIVSPFRNQIRRICCDDTDFSRSMGQQMSLFQAYCQFTKHECIQYDDNTYLASSQQFEDYIFKVYNQSIIKPVEADFVEALLSKFKVPTEEEVELCLAEVCDMFHTFEDNNHNLPEGQSRFSTFDIDDISMLDSSTINKLMNTLVKEYGVKSDNAIFFSYSTLNRPFRSDKAYKNVKDVRYLLNRLFDLGFLERLEYKRVYHNSSQWIYYFTPKVETLKVGEVEPMTDDEIILAYESEIS